MPLKAIAWKLKLTNAKPKLPMQLAARAKVQSLALLLQLDLICFSLLNTAETGKITSFIFLFAEKRSSSAFIRI